MGRRTKVIASGEKLAEELEKADLETRFPSEDNYFVSDLTPHFKRLAEKILGERVKIGKIAL